MKYYMRNGVHYSKSMALTVMWAWITAAIAAISVAGVTAVAGHFIVPVLVMLVYHVCVKQAKLYLSIARAVELANKQEG